MKRLAIGSPSRLTNKLKRTSTFRRARFSKLIIAIFIGLGLNGCATLSPSDSQQSLHASQHYNWQTLQSQLNELSSWEFLGKIGVRSPQNNFTAAIHRWTQVDDLFNIDLASTFFGIGASNISGNAYAVMLSEAGEAPMYSDNPNALIEEQLGLPLPITYLSYWIKGLPLPSSPADITFNSEGLPKQIQQLGWTIDFSKHTLHSNIPLPGKIKLSRNRTSITLAIKQWTLI